MHRYRRPPDTDALRIVDFFEEGVAAGQGVLELIGSDVAAFCDDLVKDSHTYADI
jgi:DNA-binding ferritin-like protein (Dps family)